MQLRRKEFVSRMAQGQSVALTGDAPMELSREDFTSCMVQR